MSMTPEEMDAELAARKAAEESAASEKSATATNGEPPPPPPGPYNLTVDLNVLNHLGFSLYSNVPAVLSEVIANSWDADAENVEIVLGKAAKQVTITDDGVGMNLQDINDRYLKVGYQKRTELTVTGKNRHVMGRKGIGKLSLFSIAGHIEVQSAKTSSGTAQPLGSTSSLS